MKKDGLKPDHVLYNTIVNGCLYNQKLELACHYMIDSFNYNVKMADDMYNLVLEKISSQYCKMKSSEKAEYAANIVKLLKERGFVINYNVYSEVAKMIYKIQGVKISFENNDKETSNWNKKYDDEYKKNGNKDQLTYQRKNYK